MSLGYDMMSDERLTRIKFVLIAIASTIFYLSDMATDMMSAWLRCLVLVLVVGSTAWLIGHELFFSSGKDEEIRNEQEQD